MLHLGHTTSTNGVHSGSEPGFVKALQAGRPEAQVINLRAKARQQSPQTTRLRSSAGLMRSSPNSTRAGRGRARSSAPSLASRYRQHIMGRPSRGAPPARLAQFRETQDAQGLWGLHAPLSPTSSSRPSSMSRRVSWAFPLAIPSSSQRRTSSRRRGSRRHTKLGQVLAGDSEPL